MGFFKNIFKRKKGGTFFGNLLRGAAGKATGGVLGNGSGLARWEAKQEQKEYDAAVKAEAAKQVAMGKALVKKPLIVPTTAKSGASEEEPKTPWYKKALAWTKKMWYIPVGVIVLGAIIYVLVKRPFSGKKVAHRKVKVRN